MTTEPTPESSEDTQTPTLPDTLIAVSDDQRQSYENLLNFIKENADPDSELHCMSPDELFKEEDD